MGPSSYTYTVEVDDDSAFGSVNATVSNISSANASQAITGLTGGTTYYFRVKAVNATGSSSWSSTSAAVTTLEATTPTINSVTLATALSSTYGTASAGVSFTASGINLSSVITATAQTGYQVSSDNSTYASSVSVASGSTVYVRLAPNCAAGTYNSFTAVILSSTNATDVSVSTSNTGNTMSQKGLTITGIGIADKVYDRLTTATISGSASYSGLANGESFSIAGTPTASFADKTAANGKSVTVSGYTAPSANYTITQPTGLTANISKQALTVTGASVSPRNYDGTTTATITGATLSGVISPDVVTVSGGGAFADANAGSGKTVTASLALGGADAANYSLAQPTLSGTINPKALTVTANAVNKAKGTELVGGAGSAAFTSSGLVAGETIGSVTITYGSGSGAADAIGIYANSIVPSAATGGTFSPSNYSITYVNGTLTVRGFTPGNLVVARYGNGSATLSSVASELAVMEFTPSGVLGQTFTDVTSGANLLTDSGTATASGHFNSYGPSLALAGYNTALGTSGVSGSNAKAINFLDTNFTVSARITLPTDGSGPYAGKQIRNAISPSSGKLYLTGEGTSGSPGGIWYYDGSSFTQISTTSATQRNIEIFNGNLYYSTATSIWQVGSGLPITSGTTATEIITLTAADFGGFAISPDGNTAYVADGGAINTSTPNTGGGLIKFIKSGSTWTRAYTFTNNPVRGLAVDFSGASPVIYATTSVTSNNKLVKIVDSGAFTGSGNTAVGPIAASTDLASAGANYVFRGVDFSPATAPSLGVSGALSSLSSAFGSASSSASVTVTGSNLLGSITATAPAGFQVSSDGVNFGSTATFSPTSGSVNETLSLRLAANASAGTYTGSVSLSTYWHYGNVSASVATASSTVAKASSTIEVTGSSSFTYNGSAQGPATSNKTGSGGAVTYSYEGTGLTSYGPSATRPTQAGTYRATATVAADTNYNSATSAAFGFTIAAATVASGDITLTPVGDGSYTASAAGGAATFNYSYAGRSSNGITTTYSSATAPTAAGYYTVTAAATGNYTGSNTTDYYVAGPVAGNDSATKPADNARIKIPTATLLGNDCRIHTDGTSLTDNLSITAVANGTGTASISGAFVLFVPSSATSDSFTYTVTDAVTGKTANGTVTVTTESAAPAFTLQIVRVVSGPTHDMGANTTTTVVDFLGVPNQTYALEWSSNLTNWVSIGNQNTGSTGSFSVTNTVSGNQTSGFFRASVVPNP